jgi:hypothetical protein
VLHALRAELPGPFGGQAAKVLLDFWLLPAAPDRLRLLASVLRPPAVMPSMKTPPHALSRVASLLRVASVEACVLGVAPLRLATARRRAR